MRRLPNPARTPVFAWTLAAVACLLAAPAQALHLADSYVESKLGQPLSAWIELLPARNDDLAAARVELLPSSEYSANPALAEIVGELRAQLIEPGNGRVYLHIESNREIREPLLSFRVKVHLGVRALTRTYSLLIDPPAQAYRRPTQRATPQQTERRQLAPVDVVAGRYGPVRSGETLWRIAKAVRPDSSVSIQDMITALHRANPQAFVNNDVNRLKVGATLEIPALSADATAEPAGLPQLPAGRHVVSAETGPDGIAPQIDAEVVDRPDAKTPQPSESVVAPQPDISS